MRWRYFVPGSNAGAPKTTDDRKSGGGGDDDDDKDGDGAEERDDDDDDGRRVTPGVDSMSDLCVCHVADMDVRRVLRRAGALCSSARLTRGGAVAEDSRRWRWCSCPFFMSPAWSFGRSLLPPCRCGPCVVLFFSPSPTPCLSFLLRPSVGRRARCAACFVGRSGCPFSFCVRSSRFRRAVSFVRACPVRPLFFVPPLGSSRHGHCSSLVLLGRKARAPLPFSPPRALVFPFAWRVPRAPQPTCGPPKATPSPIKACFLFFFSLSLSALTDDRATQACTPTTTAPTTINQRRASRACDKGKKREKGVSKKKRSPLCIAVFFSFGCPSFSYYYYYRLLFLFAVARFARAQEGHVQTSFSPRFSLFFYGSEEEAAAYWHRAWWPSMTAAARRLRPSASAASKCARV